MCKCGSQMCRVLTWGLKSLHQILEWTLFADHKVLCLMLYEICREYKTKWEKTVDAGCWTVLVNTTLSFACPHNNNIITFPLWWQVKLLKLKIWNNVQKWQSCEVYTSFVLSIISHYQKWAQNMNSCYTACKQYSSTKENCLVAFIGMVTLKNFICRFKS